MSFGQSISSVFGQYATFSGRARRSEYWWFVLFSVILGIVIGIIDAAIKSQVPGYLLDLALLVPSLAVGARRLHDTSRSGWWLLIGLIPLIGAIVLIVFFCQDSQGPNNYGPSPKTGGPMSPDPAYPTGPYGS